MNRKEIKNNYSSLANWTVKNNYPDKLQLLCYNCNLSIGFFEYCPHSLNKGSIL